MSGIEAILAPFPRDQVQQRKGPGGMEFDYVPAEVMIRRLVDSGLEYSFTQVPGCPPQIMSHGNGVNVMLYYGRLHIPALGPAQDDVGTAFIHPSGNEEQYKSAASDCLKRCARLMKKYPSLQIQEVRSSMRWVIRYLVAYLRHLLS